MRTTLQVLALAGLVVGLGSTATAQAPRRGVAPQAPARAMVMRRGGEVTAILNARRELDLTPRQVAQLDSIERVRHAERKRLADQMAPAMDSMRQRMRGQGVPRDSAQRAAMRAQMEQRRTALRPQMEQLRTRDSAAAVAAERLLTDAQRGKWRELQAERRGFARGVQAGRGAPGMRGRPGRPPQGMRGQPGRAPQGMRGQPGRPPQEMMRRPVPDRRPEGR
ncbi:MAG: hypothetical protein KF689_10375 [Gemmatimonadaceae bacterium]|nr:hypothetical protein [Gemmatimonadaceae bacterium]MCW5825997.1 hypothetical protein [Gemmatimonadaceae bacterium]